MIFYQVHVSRASQPRNTFKLLALLHLLQYYVAFSESCKYLASNEMNTTDHTLPASNWGALITVDTLSIYAISVFVVAISAFRALQMNELFQQYQGLQDLSLRKETAILFPFVASISLVFFFYYFDLAALVSLGVVCMSVCFGIVFVFSPYAERIGIPSTEITVPCMGTMPVSQAFLCVFSWVLILYWLVTGSVFVNNIMGATMSIVAICFIRVPNMKVATLALLLLFVYDIFWVFYSARFFGANVMVTVASKQAVNPVAAVAKTLNLPSQSIVQSIHLPVKLIFGHSMLGLGDMVMPGLVAAFALRVDQAVKNSNYLYFKRTLIGYSVGMFMAMVMAFVYRIPQPALLYLVPCTIIPLLATARQKNQMDIVWDGVGMEDLLQPEKHN